MGRYLTKRFLRNTRNGRHRAPVIFLFDFPPKWTPHLPPCAVILLSDYDARHARQGDDHDPQEMDYDDLPVPDTDPAAEYRSDDDLTSSDSEAGNQFHKVESTVKTTLRRDETTGRTERTAANAASMLSIGAGAPDNVPSTLVVRHPGAEAELPSMASQGWSERGSLLERKASC